ncbi:PTS system, cellobiose-specific IIC component [Pilibacter termitis]|uniref:Permease IIC component n=1 Tax=Pilibacter termitis TaxID=263852 RepID=A0A1T4P5M6_9ENTE|nr:PTS sugar transporter subunit IIC [Pilibacter termitis]SJZ86556.1 PTS system, cellobiose-specific IIC component [Pilibacter termitis]
MKNFNSQAIIAPIMRFVNMRGIIALKDGMLAILPLTVVGSIFLIIGQIPSEQINKAIADVFGKDWTEPFMQVYSGTFAIMGLISCFAIGYAYAKNSDVEPLPAGVLSLSAFFITLKSSYIPEAGEPIGDAISKVWFGGQGIIGAIIIGLTVGAIYTFFIQKKIVLKMPEQVPEAISKQFAAMTPAFAIFLLSMIVYIISKKVTDGGTFIEMIYKAVQVPLQGLTGSLGGAIGIAFFISFLWWFGVHGQSVVNGIVTALLLSNLDANKDLLAKGQLSVENGAHIVTQQFLDSFLIISGSGITFGIVIAMLFAAKSQQYKALGKVAAFPAIFNVNEPIIFGFPVVMNPIMFVPFLVVPIISALLVYGAIAIGFLAPFSGVTLPWSTPAIISGLMVGGWKAALLQIVILAISTAVYFPFFKVQDKIAYENELKQAELDKESVGA